MAENEGSQNENLLEKALEGLKIPNDKEPYEITSHREDLRKFTERQKIAYDKIIVNLRGLSVLEVKGILRGVNNHILINVNIP